MGKTRFFGIFSIDYSRASVYYIGMKRYIPFLLLAIALLCVFVVGDSSTDLVYADEIPVIEFTYDSSDGQTEYVGDNFVVKVRGTDEVIYVGGYDEAVIKTAIENEVGTDYNVVIPYPTVSISLQGNVYESEFSSVVHPFSLTAVSSHPFWRIGEAFSSADPEFGYAWRYSTKDTDGVEVEFGGTASSVGFGGGRSHGVYTVRCMATVGFKFDNSTLYAGDVSDGVELTITRASSEPDVSALVETVEYGKSVNDILSSKNTPSAVYFWSLEKGEFGDTVLDVGNYAYSVSVVKGKYSDGSFVKDDNFSEYITTLAVKVEERRIYVKASDISMVYGKTLPAVAVELHDSSLAPEDTIEDVGITVANDDFSVGERNLAFGWNNTNYIVYFMSARNDGRVPQLIVLPNSVTCADEHFVYTAYREDGFGFDDVLYLKETDDGITLEILRNGEVIPYDDITLVLTKADGSNAVGINVGKGIKKERINFENGEIVLDGLNYTFTVLTSEESVDYISLAIGLGGWLAAVVIGFALSLLIIKGKKSEPTHETVEIVAEVDTDEIVAPKTVALEITTETVGLEKAIETVEVPVREKDGEDGEKTAKVEQKRRLNDDVCTDKTPKEIYDEQNRKAFEALNFLPTPTVEEAFNGVVFDDGEAQDNDANDEKEDGGKITFSSKMMSTSVQNQAIYNALKNEILSYRGVKSRVVNGGDYFRRPGKQIAKIIIIGKTLRLALALNPSEYDYNLYHQKDRGSMKKYSDTPMFVKVQSPLGVRRAFTLIADLMEKEGLKKNKKYEYSDGMYTLIFENKDEE